MTPVPADRVPADRVPADPVPADPVPADPVPADRVPADPVAPPPAPGPTAGDRAGRNLPVAAGVGLALVALVLGTLYTVRELFVVLVVLAVAVAGYELTQAFRGTGIGIPLVPVVGGSAVMLIAAYAEGADALAVTTALTLAAVVSARLAVGGPQAARDATVGALVVCYLPLLAAFAMLMLASDDGPNRIVLFILAVVMSDTGGYAVGVLFGRHRMAPRVSPKKSWEGFAGSVGAAAVVTMAAGVLLLDLAWWQGLLFGLVVVGTATVGDLGESLLKRDLGVKDMGSLLPEHGGIMDRLDSLLPTAPVAAVLLAVFLDGTWVP